MADYNEIKDSVTEKGNAVFDVISTVDVASRKFQKRNRKGSIAKAAKSNLFEFPVFVSKSVGLDYATATVSLLEQLYASYLQQAISKNPIVDADLVRRGLQFADYKTDTNKYLEYTEIDYAHDACHNEIPHEDGKYMLEFNMLSIEDSEAITINEAYNYEPLSEFSHFFQEANKPNTPSNKPNYTNQNVNAIVRQMSLWKEKPTTSEEHKKQLDIAIDKVKSKHQTNFANKILSPSEIDEYIASVIPTAPSDPDYTNKNIDEIVKVMKAANNAPQSSEEFKKQNIDAINKLKKNYKNDLASKELTPEQIAAYANHMSPEVYNKPDEIDPKKYLQQNYSKILKAANDRQTELLDKFDTDKDKDKIDNINSAFNAFKQGIKSKAGIDGSTEMSGKDATDYVDIFIPKNTNFDSIDETKANADAKFAYFKSLQQARDRAVKDKTGPEVDVINARYAAAVQSSTVGHITADEFGKLKESEQNVLADVLIAPNRYEKVDKYERIRQTADAVKTGLEITDKAVSITSGIIGAVDRHKQAKLERELSKIDIELNKKKLADYDEDRALRKAEIESKELDARAKVAAHNKVKAPEMIREGDINKLNTMKPLLMTVELAIMDKNDQVSRPIQYVIGVKCYTRTVDPEILPEVAEYPLKEMNKLTRKVKWRAGELKFFKDIVFNIKQKKQTAADSRDPKRKWYRRLYELAHIEGDAPAAAVIQGKSITGTLINDKIGRSKINRGAMPNATIIMAQSDVDNIKAQTDIDLLSASSASKFCKELFLLSLVVIDDDAESIKMLVPALHNDYEIHSLASVKKQLSMLDTVGAKTRDMFKVLGN